MSAKKAIKANYKVVQLHVKGAMGLPNSERFIAECVSKKFFNRLPTRPWLSHAFCEPGSYTAKSRRKCTRQLRFCL